MKKIIIVFLIFILISVLFACIYLIFFMPVKRVDSYTDYQEELLSNSHWIKINNSDLDSYLSGIYTDSVEKIISSVEESTPVIFRVFGGLFSNNKTETFIVASAFNSDGNIYIYTYDDEKYTKKLSSLEKVLENATAAFIYTGTEVLQ